MSETDPRAGNAPPEPLPFRPPLEDSSRPFHHRYAVGTVCLTIHLVIHLRLSYRIAVALLALFAPWRPGRAPAFTTVRHWLLRLGLYLLRRTWEATVEGWILLLDHTVQLGQHKCLTVGGLPRSAWHVEQPVLRHQDVKVLAVEVRAHANGEEVHRVLQQVERQVGRIDQVVSDHGADLLKGIRRLQHDSPQVLATYDIRHLIACQLKAEWASDPRWQEFLGHCTPTLPQLRQTAGQGLAPPALRTKARSMNVGQQVDWAGRLLAWQDQGNWQALREALERPEAETRSWYTERLGWLEGFRDELAVYRELLAASAEALADVVERGLSWSSGECFWQAWQARPHEGGWRVARYAWGLRCRLVEEGRGVPLGRRVLGSSDVIESLFGKYKELVSASRGGQLGANVLLLPLLSEEWTAAEIKEALETVRREDVEKWLAEQMGTTRGPRLGHGKGAGTAEAGETASANMEGPKVA